ncbi:MAG: hypothetical protein LBV12_03160 [Puniceicoccales bacterium]|jgi:hypothetical protein|nr:hypothetical protein [Puniceicoccales bacterium]
MNRNILLSFFSLLVVWSCSYGQNTTNKSEFDELKGYTALSVLPIGERPQLGWKAEGKGIIVDPNADKSGFPPGILYYKKQSDTSEKNSEKKDPYTTIQFVLGMASQWEFITPYSRSINLFVMSGKTAEGAPLYKDYTTVKFPENSRGGIVFLWQKNTKNWDNPNQLIVPLETFVNPATMIPTEGVLVVNTLPYKLAYVVGTSKGVLDPGGKAFIPSANPTATIEFELSIFKNGKWESMMKSRATLQEKGILFFYAYRNVQNRQKNLDKINYKYMPLPKLPQPEQQPVSQPK